MNASAKLLATLGICLYFAMIPAFAQGGRGGGRSGGPPPWQAPRSGSGPAQQAGPGRAHSAPLGAKTSRSMAAAQALEKNPELSSRLQSLLPEGTNVYEAAAGFDNLGQFVSAVHVSHNLGLPFNAIKQEIISGSSLGQAIQKLKPGLPKQELEREMRRAEAQAKAELNPQGVTNRTRDRDREQTRTKQRNQP